MPQTLTIAVALFYCACMSPAAVANAAPAALTRLSVTGVAGAHAGIRYTLKLERGSGGCRAAIGPVGRGEQWKAVKPTLCTRARKIYSESRAELDRLGSDATPTPGKLPATPLPDAPELGILTIGSKEIGVDLLPVATCNAKMKNCQQPASSAADKLTRLLVVELPGALAARH